MFVNSALNEGLAGMQQSHKKMAHAAEQIVKAGLPTDNSVQNVGETGAATLTNSGAAATDLPSSSSVNAVGNVDPSSAGRPSQIGGIVEPLIEMKQQELIFDASASVVKMVNDTLGQVVDDLS